MPVTNVPQSCRFNIQVEDGVSASGGIIMKNQPYSGVKASATDAAVYAVANAIAGLQSKPVINIQRMNESTLLES